MSNIIFVPWQMQHEKNKITAVGFESRRAAYRSVEGKNVAMVQVRIIPKKFLRSAEPVPKKNHRSVKRKKRK